MFYNHNKVYEQILDCEFTVEAYVSYPRVYKILIYFHDRRPEHVLIKWSKDCIDM